jgi:DUF4097 and DUF4098 domain-containing protein YvlB
VFRIFPWSSAGGLCALLLLAACSKSLERSSEILKKSYPIESTARLTIRNLTGSISIRGTDTEQVTLHATKKAASAEQLKNINIAVDAEPGSISIATSILPQKKGSFLGSSNTVDYVLVVPRTLKIARLELDDGKVLVEGMEGEDVRTNVVDGQLTIRDCCANIHLAIANGDLDLSYEHCAPRPFIAEAQITHGNARVSIPRGASFHARAQTAKGTIENDFADMVEVNSRSVQKIDVAVGNSVRSELAVRVTTGDIKIAAVGPVIEAGPPTVSTTANE